MVVKSVSIAISPGELIDKITILQIKSERVHDAQKLVNINHELSALTVSLTQGIESSRELRTLTDALKSEEQFDGAALALFRP